ncbi:MAG TPA: hypothetical protein V6C78_05540 [Crinalium sp.]|jgi:hypothetical protein
MNDYSYAPLDAYNSLKLWAAQSAQWQEQCLDRGQPAKQDWKPAPISLRLTLGFIMVSLSVGIGWSFSEMRPLPTVFTEQSPNVLNVNATFL